MPSRLQIIFNRNLGLRRGVRWHPFYLREAIVSYGFWGRIMQYTAVYQSPLGEILLAADDAGLTGLWFEGQKYYACGLDKEHEEKETPVLRDTRRFLDIYFSGKEPGFTIPLHTAGTPFQMAVWEILRRIPYGETVSYGEIARELARGQKNPGALARAVGGAVGHNRISILIPCHRILGAGGSLTGYAGGIDRKRKLLDLEGGKICEE